MKSFVLVSEEAISKGIRRIVALTGPEALKAEKKCNSLQEQVENIQNLVEQKMKEGGLKFKETSQEISKIGEVRIDYESLFTVLFAKNARVGTSFLKVEFLVQMCNDVIFGNLMIERVLRREILCKNRYLKHFRKYCELS